MSFSQAHAFGCRSLTHRTLLRVAAVTAVTLLLAAVPRFSLGQEADPAKAAYALALHHYKAGDFKKAAPIFHQAYSIRQLPVFLFNAARSEQKSGQFQAAKKSYEKLLQSKDLPEQISVKARGYLEEVTAELKKKEQAEAARRAAERQRKLAQRAAASASTRKLIAWGTLGGGALLLGAGGYFLATWASGQAALDDQVADRDGGDVVGISFEAYTAEQDRLDRTGLIGGAAFGVGAVAAGLGAWLAFSGGNDKAAQTSSLYFTGREVRWQVRF